MKGLKTTIPNRSAERAF